MNKPEPIRVDNELFEIIDERYAEPTCLYIGGPNMNLSPFEAQELRDWLTEALNWMENEYLKENNANIKEVRVATVDNTRQITNRIKRKIKFVKFLSYFLSKNGH